MTAITTPSPPLTVLAVILIACILAGCGSQSQSRGQSANAGDSGAASADQPVSISNPGFTQVPLANGQNQTADNGASADAVRWTTEPIIQAGALTAAGTLDPGVRLSEPMNDEPSAFSVYYGQNAEVLAELLPDLGPMHTWDTDATVAPSDFELQGDEFTIRAYSPLFMDVGPADLLLRVWGYDETESRVLLSVHPVGVE